MGHPTCWRYDQPIVYRFELAINRIRRLFTAFATAAAIGGLIGSPAAFADDDPPPPPPTPDPVGVPRCVWISNRNPCAFMMPLPPQPPDTPGTPDGP